MRLLLLVALLAAAGCGGSGEGTVTGQVLFDDKPLPGGRVTFRPADPKKNSVSAELDQEGRFKVTLPAGEVHVSVDNRELEPAPPGPVGVVPPGLSVEGRKALGEGKPAAPTRDGSGRHASRYVKIPDRYYTVETSELKFTVTRGEQKHDIKLKR